MNFYKIVSMIAIVILIISLAIIGTTLADSQKNLQYPPNITECPDSYIKNDDGICIEVQEEGRSTDCRGEDFNSPDYSYPGIGPTSGLCAKKLWAKKCMVDWDGVTNNPSICYSTNE